MTDDTGAPTATAAGGVSTPTARQEVTRRYQVLLTEKQQMESELMDLHEVFETACDDSEWSQSQVTTLTAKLESIQRMLVQHTDFQEQFTALSESCDGHNENCESWMHRLTTYRQQHSKSLFKRNGTNVNGGGDASQSKEADQQAGLDKFQAEARELGERKEGLDAKIRDYHGSLAALKASGPAVASPSSTPPPAQEQVPLTLPSRAQEETSTKHASLEAAVARLEEEKDRQVALVSAADTAREKCSQELQTAHQAIAVLQKQLREQDQERSVSETAGGTNVAEQLQAELEHARNNVEEEKAEFLDLSGKMQLLRREKEDLHAELQACLSENRALADKVTTLQQPAPLIREFSGSKKLESDVPESVISAIQTALFEGDDNSERGEEIRQELCELDATREAEGMRSLHDALRATEGERNKLKEENLELQQALNESSPTEDKRETTTFVEPLCLDESQQKVEVAGLRARITQLEDYVRESGAKHMVAQRRVLQEAQASSDKVKSDFEDRIAELVSASQQASSRVVVLEKQLSEQQSSRDAAAATPCAQCRKPGADLEQSLEQSRKRIKDLEDYIRESSAKYMTARREATEALQSSLDSSQKECDTLRLRTKDLEGQVLKLQSSPAEAPVPPVPAAVAAAVSPSLPRAPVQQDRAAAVSAAPATSNATEPDQSGAASEIAALKKRVEQLQEYIRTTGAQSMIARKKATEDVEKENSDLKKQLEEATKAAEAANYRLGSELNNREGDKRTLEAENSCLRKTFVRAQQDLEKCSFENANMKSRLWDIEQRGGGMGGGMGGGIDVERFTREIQTQRERRKKTSQELARTQRAFSNIQEILNTTNQLMEKKTAEIVVIRQQAVSTQNKLQSVRQENDRLWKLKAVLEDKIDSVEESFASAKAEITEGEGRIAELEGMIQPPSFMNSGGSVLSRDVFEQTSEAGTSESKDTHDGSHATEGSCLNDVNTDFPESVDQALVSAQLNVDLRDQIETMNNRLKTTAEELDAAKSQLESLDDTQTANEELQTSLGDSQAQLKRVTTERDNLSFELCHLHALYDRQDGTLSGCPIIREDSFEGFNTLLESEKVKSKPDGASKEETGILRTDAVEPSVTIPADGPKVEATPPTPSHERSVSSGTSQGPTEDGEWQKRRVEMETDALRSECERVRAELEQLIETRDSLSEESQTLEKQIEDLQTSFATTKAEFAELEVSTEDGPRDRSSQPVDDGPLFETNPEDINIDELMVIVQRQLTEQETKVDFMNLVSACKVCIEEFKTVVADLRAELASCRDQVADLTSTNETADARIVTLDDLSTSLKSQLIDAESRIKELEEYIDDSNKHSMTISTLMAERKELEEKIENLEEQVNEDFIKNLEGDKKALQAEINELETKCLELQATVQLAAATTAAANADNCGTLESLEAEAEGLPMGNFFHGNVSEVHSRLIEAERLSKQSEREKFELQMELEACRKPACESGPSPEEFDRLQNKLRELDDYNTTLTTELLSSESQVKELEEKLFRTSYSNAFG